MHLFVLNKLVSLTHIKVPTSICSAVAFCSSNWQQGNKLLIFLCRTHVHLWMDPLSEETVLAAVYSKWSLVGIGGTQSMFPLIDSKEKGVVVFESQTRGDMNDFMWGTNLSFCQLWFVFPKPVFFGPVFLSCRDRIFSGVWVFSGSGRPTPAAFVDCNHSRRTTMY